MKFFTKPIVAVQSLRLLLCQLVAIGGSVVCMLSSPARAQDDSWISVAPFRGGAQQRPAVGFSIGTKGYVRADSKFWEFDPSSGVWTQKADFGGSATSGSVGFSIGTKGYIGTGSNAAYTDLNEFWEYDPANNAWTRKADFGGSARSAAVGFSIGTKGYIGTGAANGGRFADFWEYDPTTDIWTRKANLNAGGNLNSGGARSGAVGFAIGTKGYIGTGFGNGISFQEYDPGTNVWTVKANFAGQGRYAGVGFGLGNRGYIGTGMSFVTGENVRDFWEYNPATNSWTQRASVGGLARYEAVGFTAGNKGYIGGGINADNATGNISRLSDFQAYTPLSAALPVTLLYFNGRMTKAGAMLGWQTAREDNNARFQIERSRDRNAGPGLTFESIGTVPTQAQATDGNSVMPLTYVFTDVQPLPGINYYRLMQTDRDGTRTQAGNVVALRQEGQLPVLFPNPISGSGEATIEPVMSYQSYQMTDVLGRIVQRADIPGVLSRVSLEGLPTGIYLLTVQTSADVQVFKIVR
jgi:hypothetical protein